MPASATCWLSLGYVTLVGGIFAMLAWNVSLRAVGAGKAAIFLNLMPLVGVSAGVLLLDEDFVWQQCFGAVGMLAGIYILTHSHQLMRYTNRRLMRRARAIAPGRSHPALRHHWPWSRHWTRAGLAISRRHARSAILLSGWPSPGDGSCSPQCGGAGAVT